MRFIYSRTFLLLYFISLSAVLSACTCAWHSSFCEMYALDTRVYRAEIIDYVNVAGDGNWFTPTVRVEITEILNGPDDLGTDTLSLVGQDGLNCGTNLPLIYEGEIIFQISHVFFDGYYGNENLGLCAELSGCGPSYLNVVDDQVYGEIGAGMVNGISVEDFTDNLSGMGDCALSVDVAEQKLTAADFQVYPNPATDRAFIDLTNLSSSVTDLNVSMVNTTGQVIRRQSFPNAAGLVDLDVTNLPAGIYFLKITTDRGEITKRIALN